MCHMINHLEYFLVLPVVVYDSLRGASENGARISSCAPSPMLYLRGRGMVACVDSLFKDAHHPNWVSKMLTYKRSVLASARQPSWHLFTLVQWLTNFDRLLRMFCFKFMMIWKEHIWEDFVIAVLDDRMYLKTRRWNYHSVRLAE